MEDEVLRLQEENKALIERNNVLVRELQNWKVAAAEKEKEKIDLMKENSELRLKLSQVRSKALSQSEELDAALQKATEEALNHLVQASCALTRTTEISKIYLHKSQNLDSCIYTRPQVNTTLNSSSDKVQRVPPLLMGGHFIQPVVSLDLLGSHNDSRSPSRNINQSRSRHVPVPMHMLQDLYIPLQRIDPAVLTTNNAETEEDAMIMENDNNDVDDMVLDNVENPSLSESRNDEDDEQCGLEAVAEDSEPEDQTPPQRSRVDNPLEGPSWLLDMPMRLNRVTRETRERKQNLEPDSTTELEEPSPEHTPSPAAEKENSPVVMLTRREFTPTMRRRKRVSSPPPVHTPRHLLRSPILANSGRILKVLVSKMRIEDSMETSGDVSPAPPAAKRPVRYDAPSPKGSTDARVIVQDEFAQTGGSGEPHRFVNISRRDRRINSRDSYREEIKLERVSQKKSSTRPQSVNNQLNDVRDDNRAEQSTSHTNVISENGNENMQRSTEDNFRSFRQSQKNRFKQEPRESRYSRPECSDSADRDSDSSSNSDSKAESRTRRQRKPCNYKERPLNRKMRR